MRIKPFSIIFRRAITKKNRENNETIMNLLNTFINTQYQLYLFQYQHRCMNEILHERTLQSMVRCFDWPKTAAASK